MAQFQKSKTPEMTKSRSPLVIIFITIFIDLVGFGIVIPVLPLYAERYGASESTVGILLAIYSAMQFVFAPVLGNLSDKYGRRPVLLFSLFGFGIDYLLVAFAPSFGWFFLARIISGITGASFTTATAYIADISNAETRAKNFGMLGAAFGMGFIIGPAFGGLLTGFGIRAPFYAAAILTLLNWLYGYFVLPESLSKENRRAFSW